MRLLAGLVLSLAVGGSCRYFDIPVPSPPLLPGALLVLAMTLGYSGVDRLLLRHSPPATTIHLCGGPTGQSSAIESVHVVANED